MLIRSAFQEGIASRATRTVARTPAAAEDCSRAPASLRVRSAMQPMAAFSSAAKRIALSEPMAGNEDEGRENGARDRAQGIRGVDRPHGGARGMAARW